MVKVDYLIIGGGIAGTTAAEVIRQRDPRSSIALLNEEVRTLYSRVLLPHFIKGRVGIDKVILRSLSDYQKNHIDFYPGERVKKTNLIEKIVETSSGRSFLYQKLLIASGGRVGGWGHEKKAPHNVFRLQTLDDARRIIRFFKVRPKGEALVVGGGFIALELLEILVKQGYKTTLVIRDKQFWPNELDNKGFKRLCDLWAKNNIRVVASDSVLDIKQRDEQATVLTYNGHTFNVDFIGVGIGLERNIPQGFPLAGLDGTAGDDGLSADNFIDVNEYLETRLPSVWAAGDVTLYPDFSTGPDGTAGAGKKRVCRNWSGAVGQGHIAGTNMSGGHEPLKIPAVYSIRHFGSMITFVNDTVSIKL